MAAIPQPRPPVSHPTSQVTGAVRRGLPRVPGGEPWPPVHDDAQLSPVEPPQETQAPVPVESPETSTAAAAVRSPESMPVVEPVVVRADAARPRWRFLALRAMGVALAGMILILAARGVTTLPGVPDFLRRHPGHMEPPQSLAAGFPGWQRLAHFLNLFLMALIIRSGLAVRYQQQPPAFYSPRRGGKKVSIHAWLHTSLDVLWLANGFIFAVLLFTTGQWARLVPTSFEVFPNAASAALQYLTLDWPEENGWVYYNSLQQLTYFTVVFIAAPFAALSGLRMSQWWPRRWDRVLPLEWARAVHFPTMVFFAVFIVGHVLLVLATGARANLNHMFAGRHDAGWSGVGLAALAVMLCAAAVIGARPMVIAPLAGRFGRVTGR